ncbi:CoF synthetase [Mycobacterium syngnathidarum]|uniref:CoF synthetase n=1 Tax=Mycobacterium syngnathidarum TaxID=1908205 RepID=A0A1Q9W7Q0_9MYCO|nr:CoF synthetase [Mycobacterium syngnathidarum]OHT92283.1 CoF synthetase [Mycobacterium syngnathidarum]OLT94155.1 CoF synthetase [Mycobacterium syngnathidarum]
MSDDPLRLDDYVPFGQVALTDEQRWPGLSASGRVRLAALEQHRHAPAWCHRVGHRLTPDQQQQATRQLPLDNWLPSHLALARTLPAYRRHTGPLDTLADFPLIGREDLVDDIAAFVPPGADLSRILHGTSSGSTGAALVMPDDPDELARGFHWLRGLVGAHWEPLERRIALAQTVFQRQAFTYTSVVPGFGEALMARLNLHPGAWAGGGAQRDAYLRHTDPQVISGTPTSLEVLLEPALVATLRPLALISGAMTLTGPLRQALEVAYDCPVLDVYGLHETRPIAVSDDGGPFVVAARRVHVEVLAGEVVVTCGENQFLPLVRYRTGDYARLVTHCGRPALADLEGREATVFVSATDDAVPCVDLTQQLQAAGARGWSVNQDSAGRVAAVIASGDRRRVAEALTLLLGRPVEVTRVATLAELGPGKPRRYSCAIAPTRR